MAEWIWGLHSVEACSENYPELVLELLVEKSKIKDKDVSKLLKKIADTFGIKANQVEQLPKVLREHRTQGIAARIKEFPVIEFSQIKDNLPGMLDDGGQWALLDRLQDPHNFGAILRSAAALGVKGIIISDRDQCPPNGTVAQVSVGAIFRVPVFRASKPLEFLSILKERGYDILSLDARGRSITEYFVQSRAHGLVWVLGSEHWGVLEKYLEYSTSKLSIPLQADVESLNVSNAAAIAFWEAQKIFRKH